jgi:hypothetical protein
MGRNDPVSSPNTVLPFRVVREEQRYEQLWRSRSAKRIGDFLYVNRQQRNAHAGVCERGRYGQDLEPKVVVEELLLADGL